MTNAASGDTVSVAAGTYVEQVSITKNLTLTGAGAASTTIKAPAATGLTANALGLEVLLDVSAGIVNASGFSVSGKVVAPNACNDNYFGVYDRGGATLNLSNVTVSDIQPTDINLFGCQTGIGIRYGSNFLMQSALGTINNVAVTGYAKAGIVIDGPGTNVTVSNSNVIGAGPQSYVAQNGIQVSRGAVASVTGNVVSGNECNVANVCTADANTTQSGGILLFNAGAGTVISGNTISDNDAGVLRGDDNATFPSVTISGNNFTGNRYEGIYLSGGPTTLTNNTITGPGNIGIQLDPATGTVTYQNNTISGYTKTGAAVPTLSGITPNTSNGAPQSITLNGTNFPPGATVTIGGLPCTSVNIPNSITLLCTAPSFTTSGAKDVVVTTADGNSATLMGAYTVTVAASTITSLSPNSGVVTGGTQVTINGTGFLPGTQVKLDGQIVSSTQVSDTKIVFTTAAHAAGTVTITVVTAGGQTSNGAVFTFGSTNAQPTPAPNVPPGPGSTLPAVPATHAPVAPNTSVPNPQPVRH